MKTFKNDDLTNAKMSEKYHGVCGEWNGSELLTKNGLKINAPAWFIEKLPTYPITGELFINYGKFEAISSIILSSLKGSSSNWDKVKFAIFSHESIENLPSHCFCIKQIPIKSDSQRKAFLAEILAKGGEGLVYRLQNGDTLKDKPRPDAEARVIAIKEGKGRNLGLIGSLICEFQNKVFSVGAGLDDDDRYQAHNYFLGKMITFSFFELSKNGIPTQAAYEYIRDYE